MTGAAYPLPVIKNYVAQTRGDDDGKEVNRFDPAHNPIIHILSGFDDIWQLGDEAWRAGGANGDGAKDYSQTLIADPAIWSANMAYVLDVTGEKRDAARARLAYLDDRRHKGVSVLDGFGPLEALYLEHATAEARSDPTRLSCPDLIRASSGLADADLWSVHSLEARGVLASGTAPVLGTALSAGSSRSWTRCAARKARPPARNTTTPHHDPGA